MGSQVKVAIAPEKYLHTALEQAREVKEKVKECAEQLSSVNAAIKSEVEVITRHIELDKIEAALSESIEVEDKVHECVQGLSSVNTALAGEIKERETLESELHRTRSQEEQARYLALHDAVTGLPNRALFGDRLDHGLAQAQRHKRGLAILYIDLDGFDKVSDSYGHAIGDEILKMAAERLAAAVRAEDTACRYGGKEFACLLQEVDDANQTAKVAEKIIAELGAPYIIGGLRLRVVPNIGICMYPANGSNAESLINKADVAMYVAKEKRRHADDATGYWFFEKSGN